MFELIGNNPVMLVMLLCCVWPLVMFGLGSLIGHTIARRGMPRLQWGSGLEEGGREDL